MTDTPTKPLVLVDGSSYLYRAFHALPPLATSDGQPTGALYGVVNMLNKLIADYAPDYMAVVLDVGGETFRGQLYADYKATRPPMPEELRAQVEPLMEVIRALGLPLLMVPGVEADDVIGTLARAATREGLPVVISTGDKDMAQIVDERVTLINTMDGLRLDVAGVERKFGVAPTLIVDYLALMGDKVDNIPGVPGVGPKTAAKWLQAYGSVEGVRAHAHEIKGKVGERLREALDTLAISKALATIRCDVALEEGPRELTPKPADTARLRALYERLELKGWLAALDEDSGAAPEPERGDYASILTRDALEAWLHRLERAELFAFDTETTDLDYANARLVGMSFAVAPGEAAYVPLAHDYEAAPAQLDFDETLARFRPLLEDAGRLKVGHNLKYDRNVLANHGIELAGIAHDTMLESYVLNSTASRHDLDTLCERHLDRRTIHFEDVAGRGAKQLSFNQVSLEQAAPYAGEDADMTLRLHRHLWPQLEASEGLRSLYERVEIALVPVLSAMECTGVLVDASRLRAQSQVLAERMREVEVRAFETAGQEFNIGSPRQIQEILYDKLGLPVRRRTPKGQPSTAEDVLQELALDYPLPQLILDHRGLSKLKSTYTDRLPEQINARTGRVHTSYHQAVASTGRLSSSDPNLQNIPIRSEAGRRIRQAFVAPEGHKLLAADYSQIELRIMAHLSGDAGLCQAFADGRDIHRATAAEVFGLAPEAVTDEQRRAAKAINFGLIYGMSAFGLARQLGIERGAAQSYVNLYFERYPGVKAYMEAARSQGRERGYVETVLGRRLYVPEINARNAQRRQYAERTAINAPMQGTAADIVKRAMIDVDAWLRGATLAARMVMQVHDELIFEVASDAVDELEGAVRRIMVAAAELAVPLEVRVAVGENWDEAH